MAFLSEGVPGAFDRAYTVNLVDATERWARAEAQFTAIGVEPVRVDAVRGKLLTHEERDALTTPTCSRFCTAATIGCAASHIKLWHQVLIDGVGVALATEDDVTFVDDFRSLVAEFALEFPPDFDVIYLGCLGCDANDESLVLRAAMTLVGATHASRDVSEHIWVPKTAWTTHAYLVSAKGARKLLNAFDGAIDGHVDQMLNRLAGDGTLIAYAVRPLLCHQDASAATSSLTTSHTPRMPTFLLDRMQMTDDFSWGYAVASPIARVGTFTITPWLGVFAAAGFAIGTAGLYASLALLVCVCLLAADLLFVLRGDAGTALSVAVFTATCMLAWCVGTALRAGVGACLRSSPPPSS